MSKSGFIFRMASLAVRALDSPLCYFLKRNCLLRLESCIKERILR